MWGANHESALTLFTCGGGGVGRWGQLNWIGMIESPPRIHGRPTIPFFKAALVAPLKSCHPFSFMAVCGFRGNHSHSNAKRLRPSRGCHKGKNYSVICHTVEGKKIKPQNINQRFEYSLSVRLCSISSRSIASAGRRLPDTHRTL